VEEIEEVCRAFLDTSKKSLETVKKLREETSSIVDLLETEKDLAEEVKDKQKDMIKGYQKIKDKVSDIKTTLIAIATNPIVLLITGIELIATRFADIDKHATEFRQSMGLTSVQTAMVEKSAKAINVEMQQWGVEIADVFDSTKAIVSNFGTLNFATEENVKSVLMISKALGISNDEARAYRDIYKGNVFEDQTRGLVLLSEVIESIIDGWRLVVDNGPLSKEPLMKTKFILHDAKLHVDHMHRGPAQIYPAVRLGMFDAMKKGGAAILEPIQTHLIEVPVDFMGAVSALIGSKRGILIDVQQEGNDTFIKAKIPVSSMIGWSNDLRSATEGRGVSSLIDQEFQKMPSELQNEVIRKIRQRKGLAENQ